MQLKRAVWIVPFVASLFLTSLFYTEVRSESGNCKYEDDHLSVTYVSDESDRDKSDIYLVSAKGNVRVNMTSEDGGLNIKPAWSLNGVDMVFQSNRDGNWEIYFISNDEETNLTQSPGDDTNPTWSPDGSRIAFVSNRDGNRQLYIFNFADGRVTRVITGQKNNFGPLWSPDGHQIAFFDALVDGKILLTDLATATTKTIVEMPETSELGWSPDGTQILFKSRADGDSDIYLLTIGTGEIVNLTNNSFDDFDPSWSPDGSKILFTSDPDGKSQIYVMDHDGQNVKNLSSNNYNDTDGRWSPTGLSISFESYRESTDDEIINSIYRMSPDGTNVLKLADHVMLFSSFWQPCRPKE